MKVLMIAVLLLAGVYYLDRSTPDPTKAMRGSASYTRDFQYYYCTENSSDVRNCR